MLGNQAKEIVNIFVLSLDVFAFAEKII